MSGSVNAPPAVDLPTLLPGALRAAGTSRGGLGGWAGGGAAAVDRPGRRTLRDWIVDVLIFVLSLSLGILLLFGQESTGHPTPRWLLVADVVFGTVACLALWWRRRWPVAIALALTPVGAFSSLSGFAVMAMVFTVAVHRRARVALLVAAANIATVPVYSVVRPSNDLFWLNLLISALATAVVLGWGMFARARRQLLLSSRTARCAPRRSSSCGSTRRGSSNAPGSPARCTTSSRTASRSSRCTRARWSSARTPATSRWRRPPA